MGKRTAPTREDLQRIRVTQRDKDPKFVERVEKAVERSEPRRKGK